MRIGVTGINHTLNLKVPGAIGVSNSVCFIYCLVIAVEFMGSEYSYLISTHLLIDRHKQITILENKIDRLLVGQQELKEEIRLLRVENKRLHENSQP